MPLSMYDTAVPVYRRHLHALAQMIDAAAAHAAAHKFDPGILFAARLYPDMWSLAEQVRAACGHAMRGLGRLAGVAAPRYPGKDVTLEDLKARIAWTIGQCDAHDPAAFAGSEDRTIRFPLGEGERTMTGARYHNEFSLPNFLFHVTTAYDILRHNGVPLTKRDFFAEKRSRS